MATTDDFELSLVDAIRKAFQINTRATPGPSQTVCIVSRLALYEKAWAGK